MNKFLVTIVTLISTQALAGFGGFGSLDRTKCTGSNITLTADHEIGDISSNPSIEEMMSKETPVLHLHDKTLINALVDGQFVVAAGLANKDKDKDASTVRLALDGTEDPKYFSIDGKILYNNNLKLINAQNKTHSVLDTSPRTEFMKIKILPVSDSKVEVQVVRVLAEVLRCLKTEVQTNPGFPFASDEKLINVCVKTAQVSPETDVVEVSRTYNINSCKPFVFAK